MQINIANRALRILLITNAMILVADAMLGPIYALFVEDIGGDLLDASLTGATFALAAGITVLITGRLSDRVGEPEIVVAFGYVLIGLGYVLYLFVDSILFLLAVQVVIGLGQATYSPSFDALYSRHLDGHKEGTEWGMWEAMNYFSIAIGAAAGGLVVRFFGFHTLFLCMGLFCLGSAFYIYRLPRRVL